MKRRFGISLASWSLHRSMGEGAGKFPLLELPQVAREAFGIDTIELTKTLVPSIEPKYLDELREQAALHRVRIHLVMVNNEGDLGAKFASESNDAVRRHQRWIDVAWHLGCQAIRVNWNGASPASLQCPLSTASLIERTAPSMRALCEYGEGRNVNVLVENHGGASSHPGILLQLMAAVKHPRFGTLPDFGNFPDHVDRYDAVDLMMPHAKAVSAKCYDFDDGTGQETTLDFERLLRIVVDKHRFDGYIGVEYEGDRLPEFEGIRACKRLLESLR